jgi:hypothetical protein
MGGGSDESGGGIVSVMRGKIDQGLTGQRQAEIGTAD